jgi:site-specific DNA-adenine methylase
VSNRLALTATKFATPTAFGWPRCTAYYYEVRSKRFRTPVTSAAAFLYLNRVCWNGLYRVNQQGKFNVPIGSKTAAVLDTDDFAAVSRRLRKARLKALDFEAAIEMAEPNDFRPATQLYHNKKIPCVQSLPMPRENKAAPACCRTDCDSVFS